MKHVDHYDKDYYHSCGLGRIVKSPKYYRLLSDYWKEAIFLKNDIDPNLGVLDYGCGLGQVSFSLENTTCFDPSKFAIDFLRQWGRKALISEEDIPKNKFDFILMSHSLEHLPTPAEDLSKLHQYVKPKGRLILILPIETNGKPKLHPDLNQHFQCWTFQTITNLLLYCNWQPVHQSMLYGPFLLNMLGSILPSKHAVTISYWLGLIKRNYPSFLTIAQSMR